MEFSLWPTPHHEWEDVVRISKHAEDTGFDRVLFTDHFMSPDGNAPTLECWTTVTALAVHLSRVKIGSLVSSVTYRNPAVLAKMAATIDHISAGRLVLGVGAGWQENEYTAYGMDFGDVRSRSGRLDEACQIINSLFSHDRSNFDGAYYSLLDAPLNPKPVQSKVPLIVGGGGERTTMRIAASYADEWNAWGLPDVLGKKSAVLDEHCRQLGRDPSSIVRSAQALVYLSEDESWLQDRREKVATLSMPAMVGTPEQIAASLNEYAEIGVTRFVVPDFNLGPADRAMNTMDLFMSKVAPIIG
jgi:F420-dependent oxidoreductase-like protein